MNNWVTNSSTDAITGLTADAAPDGATDYAVTYDASTGLLKKVLLNSWPTAAGGEINLGANLGVGYPTYATKTGVTLNFNTLTNDATLTVASNANTFTWSVTLNGIAGAQLNIDATAETEIEAVVDLQSLQGAVTDAQVPNSITIDLATLATTATTANAVANNSVTGAGIAITSQAAGDIMYYDGTDWVRLAKGTAGQVLEMNAGATAPEWDTDDSGGAGSQTPWTSDINGDGFSLTNAASISLASTNAGQMDFNEASANGTSFISLKAPDSLAATVTNTLPSSTGILINDTGLEAAVETIATLNIQALEATNSITVRKAGSDTIASGPYYQLVNPTASFGAISQLGAVGSLDFWVFDQLGSGGWNKGISILTNGSVLMSTNLNVAGSLVVSNGISGAGGGITLDASGFNLNLTTTDNTLQEVAQKFDDFVASGSNAQYVNGVNTTPINIVTGPTIKQTVTSGTNVTSTIENTNVNTHLAASLVIATNVNPVVSLNAYALNQTNDLISFGGTLTNAVVVAGPFLALRPHYDLPDFETYTVLRIAPTERAGASLSGTAISVGITNSEYFSVSPGGVSVGNASDPLSSSVVSLASPLNSSVLNRIGFSAKDSTATTVDLGNIDTTWITNTHDLVYPAIDFKLRLTTTSPALYYRFTPGLFSAPAGYFTNTLTVGGGLTNNALTASQAVVTDANKALASVAYTGAGNVMRTRTGVWRSQWIDSGAWKPSQTNPAVAATIIAPAGADYVTEDCYGFNDTTEQSVEFKFKFPRTWDAGTIKYTVDWKSTSTSGTNVWALKAKSVADKESTAGSWGSEITVLDQTDATANEINTTGPSASLTVGGTPAVGETVYFKLSRKPGDGSDNMSGDGKATGLWIQWLESTTEPAAP